MVKKGRLKSVFDPKDKQQAKQAFDSHPRKCSLSFDELFGLFQIDCNNFQGIGTKSVPKITREAVG